MRTVAERAPAPPVPTPSATITLETPRPTPARLPDPATPRPAPKSVAPPARSPLTAFRGLGSWIDAYDYSNDPASIVPLVRVMATHGVKTLYLETSRRKAAADIAYPQSLGMALDVAKGLGMRVVAWYPPTMDDPALDMRRSLAAINFHSPEGNRFDAFGADIEYSNVKNAAERNRRAAIYSRDLRRSTSLPLAAIVYPPTQIQRNPSIWPNYPWRVFGTYYDIVMPMHYWTFHTSNPKDVFASTVRNEALTRALTGKPAHVIGGLAEGASAAEISAYVSAAIESGSIGGSIYDGRTTTLPQWVRLAPLNR
jgi:hypothetical protein